MCLKNWKDLYFGRIMIENRNIVSLNKCAGLKPLNYKKFHIYSKFSEF